MKCNCGCGGNTKNGNKYINGHNRRKWSKAKWNSPEYQSWNSMIQRCGRLKGYENIKVCRRWKRSFDAFLKDMGPRPSLNHTIDRINGNKNYYPSNCRWATKPQQNKNRKDNVWITYNGETKLLTEWAKYFGMTQGKLSARILRGNTFEEAING